MSYTLIFHQLVLDELQDAYEWYEQRRNGLSLEFMDCIDEVIRRIQTSPLSFQKAHRQRRKAQPARFPYLVVFEIHGGVSNEIQKRLDAMTFPTGYEVAFQGKIATMTNFFGELGLGLALAVIEGCGDRFRPVLMTAGTTIFGLLPTALVPIAIGSSGNGGECAAGNCRDWRDVHGDGADAVRHPGFVRCFCKKMTG